MSYQEESPFLSWQQIDWSYVPYVDEPWIHPEAMRFRYPPAYFPRTFAAAPPQNWVLEYPPSMSADDLLEMYRDNGFDADVILQNPFTHTGPATVCTLGFPLNLPRALEFHELKRYRRWVCRIHVDLKRARKQLSVSFPHVEVDPAFHPVEHLRFQREEVYGPSAVEILKMLLS